MATKEQLERFGKVWAAMAITEPSFGSDSAAVSTTATLDGDEYVINGEKIFVTAGSRATHIVVWATVDKSLGRAAIKSFVVPREHPGVIVERLEHKLGIKASDTAVIRFDNARIPKENLLGDPEVKVDKASAGSWRPSTTPGPSWPRWLSASPGRRWRNCAPSSPTPGSRSPTTSPHTRRAPPPRNPADGADWEAGYLLTVRSAWQADNKIPNSKEASMGKAKAARVGTDITLKTVEMAGTAGYSEEALLEKWARDSKILDIFEGTQQIQQLVVARRLLGGLSSAQLK